MKTVVILGLLIVIGHSVTNGRTVNRLKRQLQTNLFIEVQQWVDMKRDGVPVLQAGYHYLLNKANSASFVHMLSEVYDQITSNTDAIKRKVIDKVQEAEKYASAYNLTQISKTKSFQEAVIYVYSTIDLYKMLNSDLRIQNVNSKLSSFALVLNSVLFNWPILESVSATTYRGINLSADIISLYQVDKEFVWLPFTSSSLSEERAIYFKHWMNNVIFVFDNSAESIWRPRKIQSMAYDPSLEEAVYPTGAMFKVIYTAVTYNRKRTYIHVKLLKQREDKYNTAVSISFVNICLLRITIIISMIYT